MDEYQFYDNFMRYNRRDKVDKTNELIEKLDYAKDALVWLLAHANGDVDCHGLTYWATEVERLREEIKKTL
jgi:hypothetical protein